MIRRFALLAALFVSFFIDGQLTTMLTLWFGGQWVFASHLFLLVICYWSFESRSVLTYAVFCVLGLFYDSHYLMTLGPVTALLPVLLFLLRLFTPFLMKGWWQRCLGFFCLVVGFEVSVYGLAHLMGLTSYPVLAFLTAQLLPTSLLNLTYGLMFIRRLDLYLGFR